MNSEAALSRYNEGRALLERGERAAGISKLREAAEASPHFKTYEILGEALLAEGKHHEACVYLAAAVGLGRRQYRSRYLLAQALLGLGDDFLVDAAVQLTEALHVNGDYRSAKELLDKLIGEHPEIPADLEDRLES